MDFPSPLTPARLVRRYKRFLGDVELEDGSLVTVHVANPGAMLGLDAPGASVWLSRSPSPTRKLPYTLELVRTDEAFVGVNTHLPNRLAAEAIAAGAIPELAGYASIRPEVRYGEASRVDFLLEGEPGRCWLEVKGVTLSRRSGLAEWPDCVSARAARHLAELEAVAVQGDRAVVLFLAQRGDCVDFAVAADIDPKFDAALRRAAAAGVEVLVYGCEVSAERITVTVPLRVI